VRRWRRRYEDDGADGLVDRRVGQRSLRRAPEGELERMRALYQQHCQAFTIKHLPEKLEKRHGHGLGYTATGSISRRAGWCGRRSTPALSITDKRTRPLQERPGPLYAVEIPTCAPHRFDPSRSPQASRGYRSLQPDVRAHSVAG
jgi:hypothetical protein